MKIDCSTCEMYRTAHCEECLVTALLHPPADVAEIDEEIEGCLEDLQAAGLVPVLKFRPRGSDPPEGEEMRSVS